MTSNPPRIQNDLYEVVVARMHAAPARNNLEILDETVAELLQWKRQLLDVEAQRDVAEKSVANAKARGTLLNASEWAHGLLAETEPDTRVG